MAIIQIWTDGSCIKNPDGPGGWAAIIVRGADQIEISGHDPSTTNNRMEMIAALRGLEAAITAFPGDDIFLYSDSQYLVRGMSEWIGEWRKRGFRKKPSPTSAPMPNQDLWLQLDQLSRVAAIRWTWVRGHNGEPMNERADRLASDAARSAGRHRM